MDVTWQKKTMGFLSRIFGKSKHKDFISEELLKTADVCPNCWGRQAYAGKFYEHVKENNLTKNEYENEAFIRKFVGEHMPSISLVEDTGRIKCKSCNMYA